MKKLLSVALCLVLIFCAMPVFAITASAATSGVIGKCTWEVDGTCLTIRGSGAMFMGGSSQMPWKDCYISEVVIEEGVTEICNYAFYKLDITRVELPSTVYSIGSNAFQSTPLQVIVLGRVHTVGSYAFSDCDSLEHIWYSGDSTSKYNMQIFHGNNDFKDAEWHFLICDSSMHSYDNACDIDCNECGYTREVPDHIYENNCDADCNECGYVRYYTYTVTDGEATITDCDTSISGDVVIPSTLGGYLVTSIGDAAFAYCDLLTSVIIPDNVTSSGDWAFYSCSSLTSVTIGNSVTSVGNCAFYNCSSLTSVTIGNSVTTIGNDAFQSCYSLTSVTIPSSVTRIKEHAFYSCTALTDVYYMGTEADKNKLQISEYNNNSILNATWHYNSCIGSATHTYDNDCDSTCNECGTVRIPDHIYDNDCDIDCNECGDVRTVGDHTYDNDCDTDCNECGDTRTIVHTYDNDCDTDCNECGDVREVPEHIYDNACDTDCNVCGDTREVGDHTYDDIFDPDCNVCGDVREIVLSNGWVLDGENWFYIIAGERATGWQFLGDVWYYFNDDGIMQTGWVTAGGNKYLFDASGHWIEGAYIFVIDLSRWQGNVKWDKLAQTDVDGVILRISYGGTTDDFNAHKDAKFEEYLENVKEKQMSYGVYHFNTATTVEMAQLQANNVVSLLKQSGANPDLPVFVDIETNGGECDLNEIAKVYISTFIANGYKPGIYSNENYWKNYLNSSEFNAYYKWIAAYGSNDGYPKASFSPEGGIENYVMWQYTSAGEISGVDENTVDFNALFSWYEKPDGWTEISGKRYHYSNGCLTYGWLLENNNWYYLNSMGEAVTGWLLLGDTWYYLKENGVMQTGWLLLGNTWYYLADGGNMVTGWQLIGGTWYYFHEGGNMATGWLNLGGTWYYLAPGGNMVTGWQNIGGTWYYFHAGGNMATGWLLIGNTWYYLADGGAMLTGWQYIGGTWYYFNQGGAWVA